jgi:hypothetical protein
MNSNRDEELRQYLNYCKDRLTGISSKKGKITLEDITEAVYINPLNDFYNLTENEKIIIQKTLETIVNVYIPTIKIIDSGNVDWDPEQYSGNGFYKRYSEYLKNERMLPDKVVERVDQSMSEVLRKMGNPNQQNQFDVKGLIIGDVQSGKTTSYAGLINKAADSGYKVFIVLTGTIETLRVQTQKRIEEGFIGRKINQFGGQSKINKTVVGVGKLNLTEQLEVASLTSIYNDFEKQIAVNQNITVRNLKSPLIFVMKKNVSLLTNLYEWLKNSIDKNGLINEPLLLIDDEADNASVNTNKEDEDPTKTNLNIKKIISLFAKSSYVGFTATPFANIFINPDSNEEFGELFPRDFIAILPTPTNYIGIQDLFSKDGSKRHLVRSCDDMENFLTVKHKMTAPFEILPETLKDAIRVFFLVNTIRDIDGFPTVHRSMMINISRFIKKHQEIQSLVSQYVSFLKASLKLFAKMENPFQDENLLHFKDTFEKEYEGSTFSFRYILERIYDSCKNIVVEIANTASKSINNDYDTYDEGKRVIIIGGQSLSRGLTLEGLIVSYLYRNTKMYDTLFQMGRWFGYRENYDNLFRIYIGSDLESAFYEIAEAIDELKNEIRLMNLQNKKPIDFGLKVRDSNLKLLITAYNKMRNTEKMTHILNVNASVIEAPYVYIDKVINAENKKIIQNLVTKYNFKDDDRVNKTFLNIMKEDIIKIISNFKIPYENLTFNQEGLIDFLNKTDELKFWDLAFIEGSSNLKENSIGLVSVKGVERSFKIINDSDPVYVALSSEHKKLGGPTDTAYGLTDEEILNYKQFAYNEQKLDNPDLEFKNIKINSKLFLRKINKLSRKPLLLVYFVKLKENEIHQNEDYHYDYETSVISLAIAIPDLEQKNLNATYKINLVKLKELNYRNKDEENEDAE